MSGGGQGVAGPQAAQGGKDRPLTPPGPQPQTQTARRFMTKQRIHVCQNVKGEDPEELHGGGSPWR